MTLPIAIDDLLNARAVESDRLEFKEGWNPDKVYQSICAFANDFANIGGGYLLIGVAEKDGKAVRPVQGLTDSQLASIQKEMIGFNNLVRPTYAPLLAIETVDDKRILVLWIPGGDDRPYEVPESITARHKLWKYYIRRYASTIEAKGTDRDELLALANRSPFDDRPHAQARLEDVDILLVRDFLRKAGSRLAAEMESLNLEQVLSRMNLLAGPPEHRRLRNVALMLFNETPERFFPYSYIDIVDFRRGDGTRTFSEKRCYGPMHVQIKQALDYFQSTVILERVIKVPDKAEAIRVWSYPYRVLEEALANAVYHRDYQEHEPISIRIESDKIRIYNLGGLDRSIKLADLIAGRAVPQRYRNRRLGDFLKEIKLTEGRLTGIQMIRTTMHQNGSPDPLFETDEDRTWFSVVLRPHAAFQNMDAPEQVPGNLESSLLIGIKNVLVTHDIDTTNQATNQATNQDYDQVLLEQFERIILQVSAGPLPKQAIFSMLEVSNQRFNFNRFILPLINAGLLCQTIPEKPQSPLQRYALTQKALDLIKSSSSENSAYPSGNESQ